MLNRVSSRLLIALVVLSPIATAQASIQPERSVIIETQPRAYVPSVTLKDVTGTFTNVTRVKILLSDAGATELTLSDLGNKTWETKLTPEQVKTLLGNKKSETYKAKLIIESRNDKGRPDYKVKLIEVIIQGSASALE